MLHRIWVPALLAVLLAAGCTIETREERQAGSEQDAVEATTEASTEATTEASTEATTEASTEATAMAPSTDGPDLHQAFGKPQARAGATGEDSSGPSPQQVVQAFFARLMEGDAQALAPYVTRDQRGELDRFLAHLEQMKQEEGLEAVGPVDVVQSTRTAVVDVNVVLKTRSGERTGADSIVLEYEDGAWRIANLDF